MEMIPCCSLEREESGKRNALGGHKDGREDVKDVAVILAKMDAACNFSVGPT